MLKGVMPETVQMQIHNAAGCQDHHQSWNWRPCVSFFRGWTWGVTVVIASQGKLGKYRKKNDKADPPVMDSQSLVKHWYVSFK